MSFSRTEWQRVNSCPRPLCESLSERGGCARLPTVKDYSVERQQAPARRAFFQTFRRPSALGGGFFGRIEGRMTQSRRGLYRWLPRPLAIYYGISPELMQPQGEEEPPANAWPTSSLEARTGACRNQAGSFAGL